MLNNNAAFKYDTSYKGIFEIEKCWSNGMVTLQYGATNIRYNIRRINPYTSDTNFEDIKYGELMIDNVTFGNYQLYTSIFILNTGNRAL